MTVIRMRKSGFTLVELVMVMTVTAVIAGSLVVFLKPAIDAYFDTRRRADLTDLADAALRRVSADIRRAVPNSIRSVSATCFQLVPATTGGRFRKAIDTENDSATCSPPANPTNCSAALDVSTTVTIFDVLSPLGSTPAVNDWVVIGNQNADDVYAGTNTSQITAVTTPRTTDGQARIAINSKQFPYGYGGSSFSVVSNTEQVVFYSCTGGKLYRTMAAFSADRVTTCGATSGDVVASDVSSCTFIYDPNVGATQQGGFVWSRIALSRSGETVTLAHGAHVYNVP